MANTTFVDSQTPVVASWLNDVNDFVYSGTFPPNVSLNIQNTGQFYIEYGAALQKLNDRVFIGGATANLGTNVASQPDWLTQFQLSTGRSYGFLQISQAAILSTTNSNNQNASNTLTVACQTGTQYDNYNAIGLVGIAVSNKATGNGMAYAGYYEAYRTNGAAGGCYGIEIDTVNLVGSVGIDSYTQLLGQTIGLQIAAGAELPSAGQYEASAAINIRNNNSTFQRGIIFGNDALTGCDGTIGTAIAIEMAKGHGIHWTRGSGSYTSSIYGLVNDAQYATAMAFVDSGVTFGNPDTNKNIFSILNIGLSSVNYPAIGPSASGNPVQYLAYGDDTNIDIQLVPKGTGAVWLGQWTSNADAAINGYVTVKDSNGNVRKLATIA